MDNRRDSSYIKFYEKGGVMFVRKSKYDELFNKSQQLYEKLKHTEGQLMFERDQNQKLQHFVNEHKVFELQKLIQDKSNKNYHLQKEIDMLKLELECLRLNKG